MFISNWHCNYWSHSQNVVAKCLQFLQTLLLIKRYKYALSNFNLPQVSSECVLIIEKLNDVPKDRIYLQFVIEQQYYLVNVNRCACLKFIELFRWSHLVGKRGWRVDSNVLGRLYFSKALNGWTEYCWTCSNVCTSWFEQKWLVYKNVWSYLLESLFRNWYSTRFGFNVREWIFCCQQAISASCTLNNHRSNSFYSSFGRAAQAWD